MSTDQAKTAAKQDHQSRVGIWSRTCEEKLRFARKILCTLVHTLYTNRAQSLAASCFVRFAATVRSSLERRFKILESAPNLYTKTPESLAASAFAAFYMKTFTQPLCTNLPKSPNQAKMPQNL